MSDMALKQVVSGRYRSSYIQELLLEMFCLIWMVLIFLALCSLLLACCNH